MYRKAIILALFALALMMETAAPLKAVEDSVLFARDGKHLVTARGAEVHIWDWRKGEKVKTLQGDKSPILALALSPDGTLLATGSDTISIWRFPEGIRAQNLKGHGREVTGLAFSPDGRSLASSSYDGTVKIWDVKKAQLLRLLKHRYEVLSVRWSPNSRFLATSENPNDASATGCNNAICLWEGSSNVMLWQIPGQRYWVNHIAFSPDGKVIAGAGYESKTFIYDVPKGTIVSRLSCQIDALRAVAFSGDGRLIAMGGDSQTVCLWKRDTEGYDDWTPLWRRDVGQKVGSIDFSPDGTVIAVGPIVQILDAKTGTMISTLK
jgi:WD40 repeat protein